jgi:hypothetical protein
MKALHFSPVNNGKKPVYNLRTNGVTEEHKSSPVKNSDKVVIQKESLPESRDTSSTVEKKSRFIGFNWEEAVNEESVSFSLEATVKKDPELYKQYLKTFDTSSEGLISSRKLDKFI